MEQSVGILHPLKLQERKQPTIPLDRATRAVKTLQAVSKKSHIPEPKPAEPSNTEALPVNVIKFHKRNTKEVVDYAVPPADRATKRFEDQQLQHRLQQEEEVPRKKESPVLKLDPNRAKGEKGYILSEEKYEIPSSGPIEVAKPVNEPQGESFAEPFELDDEELVPEAPGIEEALEERPFWMSIGDTLASEAHLKNGLPNQDSIKTVNPENDDEPAILAVADGHGSQRSSRSHIGADIATDEAVNILKSLAEKIKSGETDENLENFVKFGISTMWKEKVGKHLKENPLTDEELKNYEGAEDLLHSRPEFPYSANLAAAMAIGDTIVYVQIGDEANISVIDENDQVESPIRPIDFVKAKENKSETYSADSLSRREAPDMIKVKVVRDKNPKFIFIATDGFFLAYKDEESFKKQFKDDSDTLSLDQAKIITKDDATLGAMIPPTTRATITDIEPETNSHASSEMKPFVNTVMLEKILNTKLPDKIEDIDNQTMEKVTSLYLARLRLFDPRTIQDFAKNHLQNLDSKTKTNILRGMSLSLQFLQGNPEIVDMFNLFRNTYGRRGITIRPTMTGKSDLSQYVLPRSKNGKISDGTYDVFVDVYCLDFLRMKDSVSKFRMTDKIQGLLDPYKQIYRFQEVIKAQQTQPEDLAA